MASDAVAPCRFERDAREAEVVDSKVRQSGLGAERMPDGCEAIVVFGWCVSVKPEAHMYGCGRCAQEDGWQPWKATLSGAGLAVSEEEVAFAVVRPVKRQCLALAAPRQQEQWDGRDLKRSLVLVRGGHCREVADFLVGEREFALLSWSVAPDSCGRD